MLLPHPLNCFYGTFLNTDHASRAIIVIRIRESIFIYSNTASGTSVWVAWTNNPCSNHTGIATLPKSFKAEQIANTLTGDVLL